MNMQISYVTHPWIVSHDIICVMRERQPTPRSNALRLGFRYILIPSLLLAGVILVAGPEQKPSLPTPTSTLEPTPYHPSIMTCNVTLFPEPVLPPIEGIEPITTYCKNLPGDPPLDTVIGQCIQGLIISHITEVKMPDGVTGFIPFSLGATC